MKLLSTLILRQFVSEKTLLAHLTTEGIDHGKKKPKKPKK